MNFLYRTAAAPSPPPEPLRVSEQGHQKDDFEKPIRTLEGLIAEDTHMPSSARPSSARPSEDGASYGGGAGDVDRESVSLDAKSPVLPGTHTDVAEDEGWITIPHSWCLGLDRFIFYIYLLPLCAYAFWYILLLPHQFVDSNICLV